MNLGEIIRSLRATNGMTQKELADKLSISPSTIGMYEQGRREPDLDTISKIANVFNVTVGYLVGTEKSGGIDFSDFQVNNSEFAFDFKMRVRDLLAEQKLSEDDFMKMTGFSKDEKDSYLYGNKLPTIEDLIKIAGVLSVSTDYLLDTSRRKRITVEEEMLLQSFNRCDDECKKYLLAKASVLCVEGISAVAAGEYGRYADEEKKSRPSSGTGGIGA